MRCPACGELMPDVVESCECGQRLRRRRWFHLPTFLFLCGVTAAVGVAEMERFADPTFNPNCAYLLAAIVGLSRGARAFGTTLLAFSCLALLARYPTQTTAVAAVAGLLWAAWSLHRCLRGGNNYYANLDAWSKARPKPPG